MKNLVYSKKIFENLDFICGVFGFFSGLFIISLCYILNLNQQLIGVVLTLASFVYLINRSKYKNNFFQEMHVNKRLKLYLDISFFIIFCIAGYAYLISPLYHRPFSYFLLMCILAGLIGIEIIIFTENVYSILFKILILSSFIRIGIYYNFPSIMGYDAYVHATIAEFISKTGSVPPLEISGKYSYYPLSHIFVSIVQVLNSIGIKNAFFGSIVLSNIFVTIFMFLFGRNIVGSRVALLSTLLLNINNENIVCGVANITPGSLVFCYLLILLYLMFDKKNIVIYKTLMVFFIFLMIITHQLTTFVSLLMLSFILIGKYIIKRIKYVKFDGRIKLNYILLFVITLQTYWMNTYVNPNKSKSFFDSVFNPLISVLRSGESYGSNLLIVGHDYQNTLLESTILQSCYLILPFFVIGGILLWISIGNNKHKGDKFSIAFSIVILFLLTYGIPFLGIRDLLTSRWLEIISILMVVLGSDYIFKLVELVKTNKNKVFFTFTLMFIVSFMMLITPAINKDNPIVGESQTINTQFKYSEIYAVKTISNIYTNKIILDFPYMHCFNLYSTKHYFVDTITLSPEIILFDNNYINLITNEEKKSLILLRKSTLNDPISVKYLKRVSIAKKLSTKFFGKFNSTNYYSIYNNGDVLGYYSK